MKVEKRNKKVWSLELEVWSGNSLQTSNSRLQTFMLYIDCSIMTFLSWFYAAETSRGFVRRGGYPVINEKTVHYK
jgi:hypothetical protein